MRKLKKGDEVIVIAGKDKGKRGSITRVLLPKKRRYGPKRGLRVTVAGVNLMKKVLDYLQMIWLMKLYLLIKPD